MEQSNRVPAPERPRLVVFYDGACGLCSGIRELIARADLLRRIWWIPLQTPGALEEAGITLDDALRTVWGISASGERIQGAAVVAAVLDALMPVGSVFSFVQRAPLVKALSELTFHVVSENRRSVLQCDVTHGPKEFPPLDEAARRALRRMVRGERGVGALQPSPA